MCCSEVVFRVSYVFAAGRHDEWKYMFFTVYFESCKVTYLFFVPHAACWCLLFCSVSYAELVIQGGWGRDKNRLYFRRRHSTFPKCCIFRTARETL